MDALRASCRRHAVRRAEGPRDGDHRRARARQARGLRGAIGYLSYTGDLDTCIHIRTVVIKDGVAHIQAGGGTVADAQPAYEFEET
jgi:anthranilate/para-aminobenzoate synthase component I